jgi:hypothetical protein
MIELKIEGNFFVLTDLVKNEEVFREPKSNAKFFVYPYNTLSFDRITASRPIYGVPSINYPFADLQGSIGTTWNWTNLITYLSAELSGSSAGGGGAPGQNGLDGTLIKFKKLSADFPSVAQTTTTRAGVTGLSFPVEAGKSYEIRFKGMYNGAVITTGGSIGFVLPSGSGQLLGDVEMDIAQTIGATGLKVPIFAISNLGTLAGSFATSTGVSVINQPHGVKADLIFHCATTGVFQVQWGTEVANSWAKLIGGSTLVWNEIIL